jgi:hypothetical protein
MQQRVFASKQVRFDPLPIVTDSSGLNSDAYVVSVRMYVPRCVTMVTLGRAFQFPRLVLPKGDAGDVR